MDLKNARINSFRSDNGAWIDKIPNMDDLRLKCRGFSCDAYQQRIAELAREARKEMPADGKLDSKQMYRIVGQVMAEIILIDWGNLLLDGKPLEYSEAQALEYLTNPDYRPFREAVTYAAAKVEEFEEQAAAPVEGNSEAA